MTDVAWTTERVAELERLYSETDLSMSQIGTEMGISRNAIIGKCHRLGLSGRALAAFTRECLEPKVRRRLEMRAAAKKRRRQKTRGAKMQSEQFTPVIVRPDPYAGSLDIPYRDLRDFKHNEANQCRFIADEPPGPLYLACGNETLPGGSYCPHCREVINRSPQNLTDDERARRRADFRKRMKPVPNSLRARDITDEAA